MPAPRPLPALILAGALLLAAPCAGALTAGEALERLASNGAPVLWSSDLPGLDHPLPDVQHNDVAALRRALSGAGFRLDRVDGAWLVTRPPPAPTTDQAPDPTTAPPTELLIVTGSRHHLPARATDSAGSAVSLFAEDLAPLPALAGDALRTVTRLPGMASLGVSAKPHIRGGLQDEVLVRMDGVELLDPWHLSDFHSLVSAIDARTVDAVDVYTGGFPARYGNRMSGVLDIQTRQDPAPASEVGVSLDTVHANTSGSSADGDTQWLAAVRSGDLERVTSRIDSRTGTPAFQDGVVRLQQRLGSATLLTLGTLYSRDDVRFRDDEESAASDVESSYLWLALQHQHGATLSSTTRLAQVWSTRSRRQRNVDEDPDADSAGRLDVRQRHRTTRLTTDLRWGAPGRRQEAGVHLAWSTARHRADGSIDTGELAAALGRPEELELAIDARPDGWTGGLYWGMDLALGSGWSLQPGLRWDVQTHDPDAGFTDHLSPRLGLRWQASERVRLRASTGRYVQPEAIHELQVQDGLARFNTPQRADHLVLGVDWRVRPDLELRLEAYRKRYRDPKVRHENLYNPFVLLPELEPDRIRLAPQRARVRGADLELRWRPGDGLAEGLAEGFAALLRLSHLEAEDRLDGRWVRRRWSQQYTAQAILRWRTGAWDLSAAATWHSGWFTTAPPSPLDADARLDLAAILNNQVMRDYLALDLAAERRWSLSRGELVLSIDLTNVLDRNNVGGIDFDIEEDGDVLRFAPDGETVLPFIPSVGFTYRF